MIRYAQNSTIRTMITFHKKSFIFSGNLGGGQDLDKLLNFYSKLKKNKSNFELSILGKGMQKISHQKITSLNIKTVNKVPYKKFISVKNINFGTPLYNLLFLNC